LLGCRRIMFAETNNKAGSARIAFGILCTLAVCCSVMYMTADGEVIHETFVTPGGNTIESGTSVGTTDVLKAGQIYTDTPRGNMRLMDYFTGVEKDIASEVQNRKKDIASVRAQMASDFAFNAASRAKLKRNMLHKMAQNAKKARDSLNHAMARTQERFAKHANLQNRRNRATLRRDKRTAKLIAADKHEQQKNLQNAVSAWQKNQAAWASATNAHIDRMNKHVAANAAQIKENAKKARKDLESTMHSWDHKINKFRKDSANARSKLSQQFKAQDKATRAWANNKIKGLVASTAAQFNDVETKMAKNRHEVDMALKKAAMRFEAALNAQKALENKRFAESVANIAGARAEAKAKTDAMSASFKVQMLAMSSEVKNQVAKVNARIDHTAGVVRSNAAAQAKVNANVNAEMTRMIKVGNKRYVEHLKHDAELQAAIGKDKEQTDSALNKMAATFNAALAKVRKDLAKDRKHNEDQLKSQTGAVFDQLKKNEAEQAAKNAEMKANTRRMRLDAMDKLRKAKEDFKAKIHSLSKVVAENDKKADAKIEQLTGTVAANAAKSKQGREEIAALEKANKNELHHAIRGAIEKGEKDAQMVEAKGEKMDKDTKWLVNNKLNAEITKLREETNAGVEKLALMSEEARAEMKKEMLFAIRSAAEVADEDLKLAVGDVKSKMTAFAKKADEAHTDNKAARDALKAEIAANAKEAARDITAAVATDARAQLALRTAQAKAIKKTNTKLTAYAQQMKDNAKQTRTDLANMVAKQTQAISDEESRAKQATEDFEAADAKRKLSVLKTLKTELASAAAEADARFGKQYEELADRQQDFMTTLGSDMQGLNDALAKQAALADVRFSKTVKSLAAARKEVLGEVSNLRKHMTASIVSTTSVLKDVNTQLNDAITVVSAEHIKEKVAQQNINRHVDEELKRLETLTNDRASKSKRARGQLRRIMDENKMAAAAEVKQLAKETKDKLEKLRATNAADKRQAAKDLSAATDKYYTDLAAQSAAQSAAAKSLDADIKAEELESAADLARGQEMFDSKIISLTNLVSANAIKAERGITRITGVANDFAKASAEDREIIKKQVVAMECDLHKALNRAISKGEADAKATQQRIAEHLKGTKRFLQVELVEQTEAAADSVLAIMEGKRQKIADNYLSLKAYAATVVDKVEDEVGKGKGRALSSIGDLLASVGALGAVHAPKAEGIGLGGDTIPQIFSGKNVKVSNAVASINGLVNEYAEQTAQVRGRWPMGIGKYLMDRLGVSMTKKGVLQVDKVEGKAGNFVYINARSVGLSNKMSDFASLAAKMSTYEATLSKLTAKLAAPPTKHEAKAKMVFMEGPEWNGD